MAKKEPEIQSQILISLYDNMDVTISYSQELTLNERIVVLTQALNHEMEVYKNMVKLDENHNLMM